MIEMWKELEDIFKSDCSDLAMTRRINKVFAKYDESEKWPVCGRFDVTQRAIRRVQKMRRDGLVLNTGYEYALALENEISNIVNSI